MNESAAKYCRNVPAVAKALGIRLFKQRGKRNEQIAEINAIIARPGFPKKSRHGWREEELTKYFELNAPTIAVEKRKRAALSNVINSHSPTDKSLRILNDTVVGAIISQQAMAEAIARKFNVGCVKMDIHDWLHGERLPEGAPRFPPPDYGSNRWPNPDAAFAWYDKWIYQPMVAGNGQGTLSLGPQAREAENRKKIRDDERSAWEFEQLKRADDKNHVPRSWLPALAEAIGAVVHASIAAWEKDVWKRLVAAAGQAGSTVPLPDLQPAVQAASDALKQRIAEGLKMQTENEK